MHKELKYPFIGSIVGAFLLLLTAGNLRNATRFLSLGALLGATTGTVIAGYKTRTQFTVIARRPKLEKTHTWVVSQPEDPLIEFFYECLPIGGGPWEAYLIPSPKQECSDYIAEDQSFYVKIEENKERIPLQLKILFTYHILHPQSLLERTGGDLKNIKTLYIKLASKIKTYVQTNPFTVLLVSSNILFDPYTYEEITCLLSEYGLEGTFSLAEEILPDWWETLSSIPLKGRMEGTAFQQKQHIVIKAFSELIDSEEGQKLREKGIDVDQLIALGLIGPDFIKLIESQSQGIFSRGEVVNHILKAIKRTNR